MFKDFYLAAFCKLPPVFEYLLFECSTATTSTMQSYKQDITTQLTRRYSSRKKIVEWVHNASKLRWIVVTPANLFDVQFTKRAEFLQVVSIACCRCPLPCLSYDRGVRLSVCLSVCLSIHQGCRGYGYPWIYPWIYPCVDIRHSHAHRLFYGYIHGYFYVITFELSQSKTWLLEVK